VDQRLYRVAGNRPHRLTRNEVPELARGLLAFIRRQALVEGVAINSVGFIRLYSEGAGVDLLVRSDDWIKLVPYLKDGTLDTTLLPVPEPYVLNPVSRFDASVLDANDRELYNRILTLLRQLFTIEFPTTDI
jgi:hypothetical protein